LLEDSRPRAIIQAVDAIAAGKSIAEAVSGQGRWILWALIFNFLPAALELLLFFAEEL